jgi:hypothetical protein
VARQGLNPSFPNDFCFSEPPAAGPPPWPQSTREDPSQTAVHSNNNNNNNICTLRRWPGEGCPLPPTAAVTRSRSRSVPRSPRAIYRGRRPASDPWSPTAVLESPNPRQPPRGEEPLPRISEAPHRRIIIADPRRTIIADPRRIIIAPPRRIIILAGHRRIIIARPRRIIIAPPLRIIILADLPHIITAPHHFTGALRHTIEDPHPIIEGPHHMHRMRPLPSTILTSIPRQGRELPHPTTPTPSTPLRTDMPATPRLVLRRRALSRPPPTGTTTSRRPSRRFRADSRRVARPVRRCRREGTGKNCPPGPHHPRPCSRLWVSGGRRRRTDRPWRPGRRRTAIGCLVGSTRRRQVPDFCRRVMRRRR